MGLKSLLSGLGLVPDLGVQMVGPSRKFVFRDLTCRSSLLDHLAVKSKSDFRHVARCLLDWLEAKRLCTLLCDEHGMNK